MANKISYPDIVGSYIGAKRERIRTNLEEMALAEAPKQYAHAEWQRQHEKKTGALDLKRGQQLMDLSAAGEKRAKSAETRAVETHDIKLDEYKWTKKRRVKEAAQADEVFGLNVQNAKLQTQQLRQGIKTNDLLMDSRKFQNLTQGLAVASDTLDTAMNSAIKATTTEEAHNIISGTVREYNARLVEMGQQPIPDEQWSVLLPVTGESMEEYRQRLTVNGTRIQGEINASAIKAQQQYSMREKQFHLSAALEGKLQDKKFQNDFALALFKGGDAIKSLGLDKKTEAMVYDYRIDMMANRYGYNRSTSLPRFSASPENSSSQTSAYASYLKKEKTPQGVKSPLDADLDYELASVFGTNNIPRSVRNYFRNLEDALGFEQMSKLNMVAEQEDLPVANKAFEARAFFEANKALIEDVRNFPENESDAIPFITSLGKKGRDVLKVMIKGLQQVDTPGAKAEAKKLESLMKKEVKNRGELENTFNAAEDFVTGNNQGNLSAKKSSYNKLNVIQRAYFKKHLEDIIADPESTPVEISNAKTGLEQIDRVEIERRELDPFATSPLYSMPTF